MVKSVYKSKGFYSPIPKIVQAILFYTYFKNDFYNFIIFTVNNCNEWYYFLIFTFYIFKEMNEPIVLK